MATADTTRPSQPGGRAHIYDRPSGERPGWPRVLLIVIAIVAAIVVATLIAIASAQDAIALTWIGIAELADAAEVLTWTTS